MFSSQLRSSFAAQQLKNSADATDQQRLEALTSFGGFGLKPVEELLVIEESDRPKLWSPSERARVLSSLEKLRYIREADVPRGALAEVLDKIKLKSLVLGEYVFSQGDHNRSFYIVLSGQMQFCVPANKVWPAALGSSGHARWPSPPLSLSSPHRSPSGSPSGCSRPLALATRAHGLHGLHVRTHARTRARTHCTLPRCVAGHQGARGGAGGRRLRRARLHHRQAARGGRPCGDALPPARLRRRAIQPSLFSRAGAQGGALPRWWYGGARQEARPGGGG